jgi:hypothetical protein
MLKKFILSCFAILYLIPALGAVELQVDRDNLATDEMLTLTITSKDHMNMTPDLSPLKKDFYIVGTNQNSQFSMINGTTQMETAWQIALLPKREGEIAIPEIQVGKEKTPSRLIHVSNVKNSYATTKATNPDIFFEASITPKEMYIQEQFVYTLKLFYNRSIENPYLIPPDLLDAKVTQNGQDILYTTVKNGKYFRVLERSYLITPKTIGKFQVTPPILKGYVESQAGSMSSYSFQTNGFKPVKVVGPVLDISVKAKPTHYSGQWLPAKKVTLNATWEAVPPIFREGEPVTRVIEVNAEGATGEQIPPISVSSGSNFNSYSQQPKRETNVNGAIQIGKLTQQIVYIPTAPGKMTLPAIKMKWWNSLTQKEQTSQVAPETIRVLPALLKQDNSSVQPPPNSNSMPHLAGSNVTQQLPMSAKTSHSYFWPLLAASGILAWLITVWLWRRQMRLGYVIRKRKSANNLGEIQKQLYPACMQNKAKQARALFLKWAAIYWQKPNITTLSEVVRLVEAEQANSLRAVIMELEAVFYSQNKKTWDGSEFWSTLQSYLKYRQETSATPTDPLPPLYFSNTNR